MVVTPPPNAVEVRLVGADGGTVDRVGPVGGLIALAATGSALTV